MQVLSDLQSTSFFNDTADFEDGRGFYNGVDVLFQVEEEEDGGADAGPGLPVPHVGRGRAEVQRGRSKVSTQLSGSRFSEAGPRSVHSFQGPDSARLVSSRRAQVQRGRSEVSIQLSGSRFSKID